MTTSFLHPKTPFSSTNEEKETTFSLIKSQPVVVSTLSSTCSSSSASLSTHTSVIPAFQTETFQTTLLSSSSSSSSSPSNSLPLSPRESSSSSSIPPCESSVVCSPSKVDVSLMTSPTTVIITEESIATTTTTTTTTPTTPLRVSSSFSFRSTSSEILMESAITSSFSHVIQWHKKLWKSELSSMVALTTGVGYVASGGRDWLTGLGLVTGTFLQSASASCLNQIIEKERDARMTRTSLRPIPSGLISPLWAGVEAALLGVSGTYLLSTINSKSALLGLADLGLYTLVYTPMKPMHYINTWIGTLPGSIPPLMGSVAATNRLDDPFGRFLFAIMYFWQIPHFMALGYKYRGDYEKGGHRMLPVQDSKAAAQVTFLHSLAMIPVCIYPCIDGTLPWWFAFPSFALNVSLQLYPSYKFMKESNVENASKLFLSSFPHLLLLLGLVCVASNEESIKSWFQSMTNFFSDKCKTLIA